MSSSQDFGVEQFFQADEFQADDPSPQIIKDGHATKITKNNKFTITYCNLYLKKIISNLF